MVLHYVASSSASIRARARATASRACKWLAIRAAFASLPNGRTPTAKDWSQLSRHWKDHLDSRIAEMTKLRDRLSICIGCGCLSLKTCRLRNLGDKLAAEGQGARLLESSP